MHRIQSLLCIERKVSSVVLMTLYNDRRRGCVEIIGLCPTINGAAKLLVSRSKCGCGGDGVIRYISSSAITKSTIYSRHSRLDRGGGGGDRNNGRGGPGGTCGNSTTGNLPSGVTCPRVWDGTVGRRTGDCHITCQAINPWNP